MHKGGNLKFILVFSTLLIVCQYSLTQESKNNQYRHLSFDAGFGNIMPTTDFVNGDNTLGEPMTKYQTYGIRMLWQNPGYTEWQRVFKAPYYGFGVSMSNFFNEQEAGYPISVYGVLGLPVKRWNRLQIYSEFQYGMAVGWKHYEQDGNSKNLAIGSTFTVHVSGGLTAYYPIGKHVDLGIGGNFVHFSNGGMERPNRGMNIGTSSLKINYHFGGRPIVKAIKSTSIHKRSRSLLIMAGYGNHQLVEHELDTNYFAIGGISAIYLEQFTKAFRLGAGTDINYWWGLNANPDGTIAPRRAENTTLGLILQPEITIDRLTLVGGIGIYAIHRNYGNFEQMYQRLGVRYDFYRNISFGVNVRAINFMLAEFMEFNLGYRIKWK